jgi:hypothetical protein
MSASRPSCHHLHATGKRCGSPALRGEQFCFYHHPTRRPPARTANRIAFQLPPITDHEELQIALCEIISRIADNTLDPQRAGLLLASLQMAKSNLAAVPAHSPEESFARGARPEPNGLPDLSGLLSVLGLQQTPSLAGH